MELLGEHFRDARLLAIAFPYEQRVNPRRAPPVTPALEDGQPPEAQNVEVSFDQQGTAIQARFEFNIIRNLFSYEVHLNENNRGEVFAVALGIEEEGDQQSDNPIVLNLMGPDMERASGEYFMTTSFREAFEEERIFLKVFADLLPASGSSQRIQ